MLRNTLSVVWLLAALSGASDFELQHPGAPPPNNDSPQAPIDAYPTYCAKANQDLIKLRAVPPLTLEAKALGLNLIQVVALVRHGARTPADRYNCWVGYEPEWNCGLSSIVQGHMTKSRANETAKKTQINDTPAPQEHPEETWLSRWFNQGQTNFGSLTLPYEKLYDATPERNVLGGTCQKGQLLAEGFQQHQIIGHWLARAYQIPGDKHNVLGGNSLVDLDHLTRDVYFRSSDMQRTILSGSALLTSFLQTAAPETKGRFPVIPLHTVDLAQETIFPNTGICPALTDIRDEIFSASGFLELRTKWRDVEEKVRAATGRDDISDVWPGEIFDCVLTAYCPGRIDLLPAGLRPTVTYVSSKAGQDDSKSLLQMLLDAVDDYAQFEYRFAQAKFSKAAVGAFTVDIKAEIIRALAAAVDNLGLPVNTTVATLLGDSQQAQQFLEYVSLTRRAADYDAKKLVLLAGHDTTIMPFLAALGGTVFDNKWPPYASTVLIETYLTRDTNPEAYFRIIYNGKVLTRNVPGCDASANAQDFYDLCSVTSFFRATQWATPANARKMCEGSSVSRETPAVERWLGRADQPKTRASTPSMSSLQTAVF